MDLGEVIKSKEELLKETKAELDVVETKIQQLKPNTPPMLKIGLDKQKQDLINKINSLEK